MRILVFEPDIQHRRSINDRLKCFDFIMDQIPDLNAAAEWPFSQNVSAIILDIGRTGSSGLETVRHWRRHGLTTPVLILSASACPEDRMEGLGAGADDYVSNLARPEEIAARLNALIRRASGFTADILQVGPLSLQLSSRSVLLDGCTIELTRMEYYLLRLFMLRAGHIISQTEIIDQLYSLDANPDLNTVEVHIGRLRRKVGHAIITTIRGIGYRLERRPMCTIDSRMAGPIHRPALATF